MKNWIIISLLTLIFRSNTFAQNLPACILKLNKKTDLTTTKFERVLQLSGDRTVYEFSITSKPQCIHCDRGFIYYDGNCNVIAFFNNARGPSGFVEFGYTAEELGKSAYSRITYGTKKPLVSPCVIKAIANTDSLKKAGIIRVSQVRIKDKVLYYFEKAIDPKLVNCKDCSKVMVYYNDECKPEVTFVTGGIAGVKGDNGYTVSDFSKKRSLKILWNAN